MSRFYLIRHGQKETTPENPALTQLGLKQAEKTADYLKQFPITHLGASPALRTQQTAQPIAQVLQLPIQTHQHIQESWNIGKVIEELAQTPHQHIALVTHKPTIANFLLRVFPEDHLNSYIPHFSLTREANIHECSITVVEYDGQKHQLHVLAYKEHLG